MGLAQQLQEKSRVGCIFNVLGEMFDDVPSHESFLLGKLIVHDIQHLSG